MVKGKVKAKATETSVRKKSAAKPAPDKAAEKATAKSPTTTTATKDPKTRTKPLGEKIAEAAYYKAQKRDFAPGFDVQDWLEAEHEMGARAGR